MSETVYAVSEPLVIDFIVDGGVVGYYEISGIIFGSRLDDIKDKEGTTVCVPIPCLNINRGSYRPLAYYTAEVPKFRNWNCQIHTFAEVIQLNNFS